MSQTNSPAAQTAAANSQAAPLTPSPGTVLIEQVYRKIPRGRRCRTRGRRGLTNPAVYARPRPQVFSNPMGASKSVPAAARPPAPSAAAAGGSNAATTATGFIAPQIVNVETGEDISSKILAVTNNGPRTICVMSAHGAISLATLAIPGGTDTLEGLFNIMTLGGLYTKSEIAGHQAIIGGLNVVMSAPDGRVLGGCVAGLLVAASPVQDISSKILAVTNNGPRTICVISAHGAISTATLAIPGGTDTLEGLFNIMTLGGLYTKSEIAGHQAIIGGLNVVMSAPDGRVLGGCVAGLLIAASPVQVILGTFLTEGQK